MNPQRIIANVLHGLLKSGRQEAKRQADGSRMARNMRDGRDARVIAPAKSIRPTKGKGV